MRGRDERRVRVGNEGGKRRGENKCTGAGIRDNTIQSNYTSHSTKVYLKSLTNTHTHTHTHTHTEWSSYAGSGLVGLVGEGVGFVRDKGASGRVLQHDTADHTDTHHQSIIWSCKPHIQVLNQLPPSLPPLLLSLPPSPPFLLSFPLLLPHFIPPSLFSFSPSLPPLEMKIRQYTLATHTRTGDSSLCRVG